MQCSDVRRCRHVCGVQGCIPKSICITGRGSGEKFEYRRCNTIIILAGKPAYGGLTCYVMTYALLYHVLCCIVCIVELSSDYKQ